MAIQKRVSGQPGRQYKLYQEQRHEQRYEQLPKHPGCMTIFSRRFLLRHGQESALDLPKMKVPIFAVWQRKLSLLACLLSFRVLTSLAEPLVFQLRPPCLSPSCFSSFSYCTAPSRDSTLSHSHCFNISSFDQHLSFPPRRHHHAFHFRCAS